MKKKHLVCPLCRRKVEELVTNLLAEAEGIDLSLIRAEYPRWQEQKGLCLHCLEYYRARERCRWIDVTPLLTLYCTCFSPSPQPLADITKRTLQSLAQVYSPRIVEMAMVEALFVEKDSLHEVLKILRHWRRQGTVKISYSRSFYKMVKEQCASAEED